MIVDCILYNGEAECFDIRLHELAGVADRFVVVEADRTFTGLARERTRLPIDADMGGRVFHSTVGIRSDITDPWQREAYQRNAMLHALKHVAQSDDDIILMGDADEIPSAGAVKKAASFAGQGIQMSFDQTLCTYYANVQCTNMRWRGTQAVRYDYLKHVTPQGVRDLRNRAPIITDAGWHFSSLVLDDPVGRMTAKIKAFSHQEVNRPEVLAPANIRRRVLMCQDIQGRTDVMFEVDRYAKLPRYMEENRGKFETLFYPGSL